MADDLATVLDIVLAAKRIARFVGETEEVSFLAAEEKCWAVVSQLSLIGEAVRRLSDGFRSTHADIPWRQIAGMRDRLVHAYDKIDWPLVWKTATLEVPALLTQLQPLVPITSPEGETPEP